MIFTVDGSYKNDLREYNEQILEKYGVSSGSAEREIMCLADSGNTVACKLFADLIFYKKVLRKNFYRDAFELYLKSAGMSVNEFGWSCSGVSYPLSFWMIGYYLVNYKRESALAKCETIDIIEEMSLEERFTIALKLAVSTVDNIAASGAINLIGRILFEVSESEELFLHLKEVIRQTVCEHDFSEIEIETAPVMSGEDCGLLADKFFVKAAEEGYVYACNNLAVREAEKIINILTSDGGSAEDMNGSYEIYKEEVNNAVLDYICFLKIAADRYEPYAANRLGLFYRTGEIKTAEGSYIFRDYIDHNMAKEYFKKATVCPDENSGWAFLNLIRYYYQDYSNNIELMNEHMDYIKTLNPKAYDIAIEL
ncbi:MAG: hypothetical protein IJ065_01480 [Eubacterium sp.]|nr:hypothetical protein [Eubacterium sp.]